MTAEEFNKKLVESGVPTDSIKRSGKHYILELDNISFVYREKYYKHSGTTVAVSPHFRGVKFYEGGHAYVNPDCPVDQLVSYVRAINESVPAVKSACVDAFKDGLKERKAREILQQVANVYARNLFGNNIPSEIVSCTIADSQPGAMDLIRFTVLDKGTRWPRRIFEIPLSEKDRLPGPGWIRDFISDKTLLMARMEILVDDETGESVPIMRVLSSSD